MLELAILGLLKEQPLHGYELRKRLADTLGFFWGVSYGSLYPALRRLERSGAIEAVAPERARPTPTIPATGSIGGETAAARIRQRFTAKSGRRTKKSYRISEHGEQLFTELMTSSDTDDERTFALKLAFCRHLDTDARLAFLERRRGELLERLDRARGADVRDDRYTRSLVEHRTRSTARDLEWVDELIAAEREERSAGQEGATA